MLAIPENILTRFNEVLRRRAVNESLHVHYRKWLRYFLDFYRKYPPPETKSEQSKSPAWDQVIETLSAEIKVRHYSRKTLKTYADWGRKFQSFLNDKPPEELSSLDVKDYLTHLAVKQRVASSTQNQTFNDLQSRL